MAMEPFDITNNSNSLVVDPADRANYAEFIITRMRFVYKDPVAEVSGICHVLLVM